MRSCKCQAPSRFWSHHGLQLPDVEMFEQAIVQDSSCVEHAAKRLREAARLPQEAVHVVAFCYISLRE